MNVIAGRGLSAEAISLAVNRNMAATRLKFLPVLLAAALFGVSAPLAKLLLANVSGVTLAALLYLGSGLGLLGYRAIRGRHATGEAALQKRDFPWLAGAILSGGVAGPIALLVGLKHTAASVASLLLNFEGVMTALIAALFFREAVGRRIWGAVLLILLGGVILTFQPGDWRISFGAPAVLAACIFWGIDNNLTRNLSLKDPLEIVTIKGICAGSFSLALSLLLRESLPGVLFIFYGLLLGFFSYGLSTVLFIYSLRQYGAARTGTLFSTAPFLGAAVAFLLLREPVSLYFLLSLPLMLAGVYLLLSERHEHLHTHEAIEHEHPHTADEHHRHPHEAPETPGEHVHRHKHEAITHQHPHTPDPHHRHKH